MLSKTIAIYNVMVAQIYIRSKVHNLNTLRDGLSDSFSKLNIHSFFFKDQGKAFSVAHQNRYMESALLRLGPIILPFYIIYVKELPHNQETWLCFQNF